MEVPVGLLAKIWSFISFLPFFFLLFILGTLKGTIIGPIVVIIIAVGNSSVVIGMWPAHFIWTYYCVMKSKRLGWVLKIVVMVALLVPLILWPIIAMIGSLLGGIGYGFFAPLIATFEAVRPNVRDKFYHCFADGCISTITGSCTVVRDFTDFCFHSYFSYMDELSEEIREDEEPMDVRFSRLPSSLLVSVLAIPVDVPVITVIALWKSPYMLIRGWKRLLEDLIGREGPFLETVCVPFAGLAILLWPLAVVGSVIAASLSSFFLALYGGVIVHQEDSFKMGLAYIVAVVSMFDEYTNDLLYLREGSCFPRPRYRRITNTSDSVKANRLIDQKNEEGSHNSKLISEGSRTLKEAIQNYTPMQVYHHRNTINVSIPCYWNFGCGFEILMQVWDWLFKSCEVNGRILLREGVIDAKDIEKCFVKGDCKKLGVKLPAWTILQCLLTSAKSDSPGLVISDEEELTMTNLPRDKVFEWFIRPLFVMKEQIKGLELKDDEEICLKKLIMEHKNETPDDWDNTGFPSNDEVRKAQLQALIRRLQGIVVSMSRIPTFRRRFRNLVKALYLEALQTGHLANHGANSLKQAQDKKHRPGRWRRKASDSEIEWTIHGNDHNV